VSNNDNSQDSCEDVLERYVPTPGGKEKTPRKFIVGAKKEMARFLCRYCLGRRILKKNLPGHVLTKHTSFYVQDKKSDDYLA
jgi:hypothetical protein